MTKLVKSTAPRSLGSNFYFNGDDLQKSGFKAGDNLNKEITPGKIILTKTPQDKGK